MIERIFRDLKQRFRILLLPPHYPLDFQPRIPAALCALQNYIQEIDPNEGDIPTDSQQTAYEPFPSDVDNDNDAGFISDDDEDNTEVKLRRINIANEMWGKYLEYTQDSDDDT